MLFMGRADRDGRSRRDARIDGFRNENIRKGLFTVSLVARICVQARVGGYRLSVFGREVSVYVRPPKDETGKNDLTERRAIRHKACSPEQRHKTPTSRYGYFVLVDSFDNSLSFTV